MTCSTPRSLCFDYSAQVAKEFGLAPEHLLGAKHLCFGDGNLFSLLQTSIDQGADPGVAYAVLQSIAERTLRFHKVVENVTLAEVIHGKPQLQISGIDRSRQTIIRTLKVLVEKGFLVKLQGDVRSLTFYGLNLPFIFSKLREKWEGVTGHGPSAQDRLALIAKLNDVFQAVKAKFEALAQSARVQIKQAAQSMAGAIQEKKEAGMALLSGVVEKATEIADKAKVRHQEKRASKPFDKKPAAALEYWNRQVEMRADKYPGYTPVVSVKALGMVKLLLKEWKAEGLSEEDMRARIEMLVENWHKLENHRFRSEKTGGSRHVPGLPNFEFYYQHRRELYPVMLAELELGRKMDEASKAGLLKKMDIIL